MPDVHLLIRFCVRVTIDQWSRFKDDLVCEKKFQLAVLILKDLAFSDFEISIAYNMETIILLIYKIITKIVELSDPIAW